ncbi:MAG: hypothetical protein GTN84_16125 [Hydrogenophaga sp.]|uniref:hypothetical protein n=1 Tax=Hydrogenophaga sp. TaxID=1904254 RepID=UPI0016A0F553|nr:hypothetical protein [Hydrogenophaga sp.]NIM42908.1 hypothetical protein [Hydrogenophaga sp.]NIN27838.1 hypothetical protein [Hydrogenophaga sp.]NIN32657.1 hypothetical protein [Hydrogenophaga sp.]NIN57111.1 hypothetical protein [Hydrogenophaga sp.]NIO53522.1 hypothetical protein [Hydrogenophaga sp.]
MFITAPGLVQFLHPSKVALSQTHWPAITLALERPWYLLVHDVTYNGKKVSQTSLVAWDHTLLDLLAQIPVADLSGIARLDRRHDVGSSWALEWIGALWTPAPCESPALGPLLFKLGADPQVRNTDLLPVAEAPGRRLLFEASSSRPGGG